MENSAIEILAPEAHFNKMEHRSIHRAGNDVTAPVNGMMTDMLQIAFLLASIASLALAGMTFRRGKCA